MGGGDREAKGAAWWIAEGSGRMRNLEQGATLKHLYGASQIDRRSGKQGSMGVFASCVFSTGQPFKLAGESRYSGNQPYGRHGLTRHASNLKVRGRPVHLP